MLGPCRRSSSVRDGRTRDTDVALSAFDDPSLRPEPRALRQVLGEAADAWSGLITEVTASCAPITENWHFSGPRFGWSLRLRQKERVLLYLTPQPSRFLVGIVLGEKAAQSAHEAGSPAAVLEAIDAAPRYAEGRGIRLTISAGDDLSVVRGLIALKTAPAPRRRLPKGGS